MRNARRLVWSSVALLVFAGITAAEASDQRNFRTHLTGEAERPTPRETRATGQAIFHLSKDGTELEYKLIASNIENVTQAHIHMGPPTGTGGIVVWLYPEAGPPAAPAGAGRTDGVLAEGTITASDLVGTLAGQPLSALLALMNGGQAYVNVHTNDGVAPPDTGPGDFPGGEIRGNLD